LGRRGPGRSLEICSLACRLVRELVLGKPSRFSSAFAFTRSVRSSQPGVMRRNRSSPGIMEGPGPARPQTLKPVLRPGPGNNPQGIVDADGIHFAVYNPPGQVKHDWNDLAIGVCAGPSGSWKTLWPHMKHYD
jgi:hypothetical protein